MAVSVDEQLLEILACPAEDHAPLRRGTSDDPRADALTCTSCGRSYPVRDGIPVLLLDGTSASDAGTASAEDRTTDGA